MAQVLLRERRKSLIFINQTNFICLRRNSPKSLTPEFNFNLKGNFTTLSRKLPKLDSLHLHART